MQRRRRPSRLIVPGRRIQIRLESGFEIIDYPSRVRFIGKDQETDQESIMLELPTEGGRPLSFDEGEVISLYEETDGGEPCTYETKVLHPAKSEEELEEEGYVLIVEMTKPPMRRREFARESTTLGIILYIFDERRKPKKQYDAICRNLSANGMLLTVSLDTPDEVSIGDRNIGVQFELPNEHSMFRGNRKLPFAFFSTVIRKYPRLHAGREVQDIGIEFDNIDPDEQDKLMGYILSLQIQQRAERAQREEEL